MTGEPTIVNAGELAMTWARLLDDAQPPDVARAAAETARQVRYQLQFIKSTGAVVPFQTYDSLAEARQVAERLIEVGTPPPVIVEVLA